MLCSAASSQVLCFFTDGYFRSPNCMRELLRAVFMGKPLTVMVDADKHHGGMRWEEVRADLV